MKRYYLLIAVFLGISFNVIGQGNNIGPGVGLNFDGYQGTYVDLGDNYNNLNFPFSFEAWIKPESYPPIWAGIFASDNDLGFYYGGYIRISSSGQVEIEFGDGAGNSAGNRRGVITTMPLTLDHWTHLAVVANSMSNLSIYFDGVRMETVPTDGGSMITQFTHSSAPASLGRMIDIYDEHDYDGAMDEVRLWNHALSQTDIETYMCTKVSPSASGLIGYWTADESYTSTILLDQSKSGINGILQGNTTRVTSGAAIGDFSVYDYSGSWSGKTIGIKSKIGDSLNINNIGFSAKGIQLYAVENAPYFKGGLVHSPTNYFGVFAAYSNSLPSYDAHYLYNQNATGGNACFIEDSLGLYKRNDASVQTWKNTNAVHDTIKKELTKTNESYRAEYILNNAPLILDLGNDTSICKGDSILLTALPGNNIVWLPQNGLSCLSCDSTFAIPDSTTIYSVSEQVGTCTLKDSIKITVNKGLPFKIINDTSLCRGASIEIGDSSNVNINWSPSSGLSCSNCPSPLATPDSSIVYIGNSGITGCTYTDSVKITVIQKGFKLLTQDTTICVGDTIVLRTSGSGAFLWKPSQNISCNTCADPRVFPDSTTQYLLTGTNLQCTFTDSVLIIVNPKMKLTASADTTICRGNSVQLSVSGSNNVLWTPSLGLSCSMCTDPIASPAQSVFYYVSDLSHCSIGDTVAITVDSLAIISTSGNQQINRGDSTIIEASGADQYTWSPGNSLSDSTIYDQVAKPDVTTTYTVTGFKNGCDDTASLTIIVVNDCDKLIIPNAFTPNGDGKNDQLGILGNSVVQLDYFKIFDRWGEVVFNTNDAGMRWDGTFHGKPEPIGVYAYVVEYLCNNIRKSTKGNITLIR